MFDVIVIGGGPAGLSAALMLGRARRRALLLDTDRGRNAPAAHAHNFLTRDGVTPANLRSLAHAELAAYPTVERRALSVGHVRAVAPDEFEVGFTYGGVERARRVVLATGMVDELPPIDGLAEIWGRSALHCPYCHGYEVRDAPLAVLGADAHRVRLALMLTRFSGDVVLCTHDGVLDDTVRSTVEKAGVVVRDERIERFDSHDGQLDGIAFADGDWLGRHAVFVGTTLRPATPFAEELGCDLLPDGAASVDDFGRTSVPGVFAVGDGARRPSVPMPFAAIIAAAASGTIAGGAIDQELLGLDFDLSAPVPALARR